MAASFHRLTQDTTLEDGQSQLFEANGWPVLLCRSAGNYHALLNRCTHAGAALAGGRIRRGAIMCPLHGAPFRLDTGICAATAVNYQPLRVFETRVEDGWVEVSVPESGPTDEDLPIPQMAGA